MRALERLQRLLAFKARPRFTIKSAWPSAAIECRCGAGVVLVIIGDATPVTCPACGATWKIESDWRMNIGPAV